MELPKPRIVQTHFGRRPWFMCSEREERCVYGGSTPLIAYNNWLTNWKIKHYRAQRKG